MEVVIDDRLLVEALLVGLDDRGATLHTTSSWYFRTARAAAIGAGGQLSGPFLALEPAEQRLAIAALLELPESIGLPEPRVTVPLMVDVAARHPRLNLLNLEAVATARSLGATVWLSPAATAGILPGVLDAEHVDWTTVAIG